MGIDTAALNLLCLAKSIGVDFNNTLTIGRQRLYATPKETDRMAAIVGAKPMGVATLDFTEPIFAMLGAENVSSMDVSPFEGATHIHDLNLPIPRSLHQQFSVVYDGGTLEHIFNIPQAFKNCMEMVRVGGHFLQANNANNFMGHGFWQLSPELIYRIFAPENGYEILAVLLHEVTPRGRWYLVQDPKKAGQRVELINKTPTYILTIAKRTAAVNVFETPPQQSDYVSRWTGPSSVARRPTAGVRRSLVRRIVPQSAKRLLRKTFPSPFAPPYYKHVKEDDLLHGRLPAF
jgi:hypothetical protein